MSAAEQTEPNGDQTEGDGTGAPEGEDDEPGATPEAPTAPETGAPDEESTQPGTEPAGPQWIDEEPAAPLSERDIQSAMDKLAREEDRHAQRIGQIMGEDALMLVKCELCAPGIPGFRFPGEVDDETKDAVRAAIGDSPDLDYSDTPDAQRCDACRGLGQVLTGSRVQVHSLKTCASCGGLGWRDLARGDRPQLAVVPPPQSIDANAPPDPAREGMDAWQRPAGHPDWGKTPDWVTL